MSVYVCCEMSNTRRVKEGRGERGLKGGVGFKEEWARVGEGGGVVCINIIYICVRDPWNVGLKMKYVQV